MTVARERQRGRHHRPVRERRGARTVPSVEQVRSQLDLQRSLQRSGVSTTAARSSCAYSLLHRNRHAHPPTHSKQQLQQQAPHHSPAMRLSDEQMMDDVAAMIAEANAAPPMKPKKRVRFGFVEELEFRVGYTSCAVPTAGGPPVGLIGTPIAKHIYEISNSEEDVEEEDRIPRGDINDVWICPYERVRMLTQVYGFTVDDISLLCREARAVQDARAQSRLDFDTSYVLRSGNLSQLQLLNELRYTDSRSTPVQTPVKKVMLFDSSDRVGIVA